MATYVGPIFPTPLYTTRWPYPQACHLYADTDQELIHFAHRIGLKARWHQKPHTSYSHFDLTPGRRKAAINAGAIPHTAWQESTFLLARRTHPIPRTTVSPSPKTLP